MEKESLSSNDFSMEEQLNRNRFLLWFKMQATENKPVPLCPLKAPDCRLVDTVPSGGAHHWARFATSSHVKIKDIFEGFFETVFSNTNWAPCSLYFFLVNQSSKSGILFIQSHYWRKKSRHVRHLGLNVIAIGSYEKCNSNTLVWRPHCNSNRPWERVWRCWSEWRLCRLPSAPAAWHKLFQSAESEKLLKSPAQYQTSAHTWAQQLSGDQDAKKCKKNPPGSRGPPETEAPEGLSL